MSQIADVGVNFKMDGMGDFESRLKSLESSWKSFSSSMDKTPEFNKHMESMGHSIESAQKKISHNLGLIKAGVVAVLAGKAGSDLFNWALGSKELALDKVFAETHLCNLGMYEKYFREIRDKHEVTKGQLTRGAYEIDSALSGKPDDMKIETFKQMSYFMTELGYSFVQSAQFYKTLMAAFGESLPFEKQKTFAKDTLGLLNSVARATKANPADLARGVATVGSSYGCRGWSEEDMFAHLAYLMPTMKSPDEAANALLRLTERTPEYAKKLAAEQYKLDFMSGRVKGGGGERFKSFDEMVTASKESAFPNRQKAAQHALAELKIGEEHYGRQAEKQVEEYIRQKRPDQIFGMLNKSVEDIQARSKNPETTFREVFMEYSNAATSILRGFALGEIDRIKREQQVRSGQDVMDKQDEVKDKQLPELMTLVKQKAEDFSGNLRGIFYEPMRALLEEWKGVFSKIEQDFGTKAGAAKLKGFGGDLVRGWRESQAERQGTALPEDNRSAGQMFQDFVATLNSDNFRNAGKQIEQAANTFMTIAVQLRDIIGSVHSALSYLGFIKPAVLSAITPGPWQVKAAVGMGSMTYDSLQKMGMPQGGPLDERGLYYPTPAAKPEVGAAQSRPSLGENYMRPGFHAPEGGWGLPSVSITSQPQVTINMDDRAIKDAVKVEVKEEIKEELLKDQDRNRANANDKGLMPY